MAFLTIYTIQRTTQQIHACNENPLLVLPDKAPLEKEKRQDV